MMAVKAAGLVLIIRAAMLPSSVPFWAGGGATFTGIGQTNMSSGDLSPQEASLVMSGLPCAYARLPMPTSGTTSDVKLLVSDAPGTYRTAYLEDTGNGRYRRVELAERPGYTLGISVRPQGGPDMPYLATVKMVYESLTGDDFDAALGAFVGRPTVVQRGLGTAGLSVRLGQASIDLWSAGAPRDQGQKMDQTGAAPRGSGGGPGGVAAYGGSASGGPALDAFSAHFWQEFTGMSRRYSGQSARTARPAAGMLVSYLLPAIAEDQGIDLTFDSDAGRRRLTIQQASTAWRMGDNALPWACKLAGLDLTRKGDTYVVTAKPEKEAPVATLTTPGAPPPPLVVMVELLPAQPQASHAEVPTLPPGQQKGGEHPAHSPQAKD